MEERCREETVGCRQAALQMVGVEGVGGCLVDDCLAGPRGGVMRLADAGGQHQYCTGTDEAGGETDTSLGRLRRAEYGPDNAALADLLNPPATEPASEQQRAACGGA